MRAKRDMNAHEFRSALNWNGFIRVGDLLFADEQDLTRPPVLAVHRTDPIRINRRATLAKLIRSRAQS